MKIGEILWVIVDEENNICGDCGCSCIYEDKGGAEDQFDFVQGLSFYEDQKLRILPVQMLQFNFECPD